MQPRITAIRLTDIAIGLMIAPVDYGPEGDRQDRNDWAALLQPDPPTSAVDHGRPGKGLRQSRGAPTKV
jgi:hypothetical protein